MIAAHTGSELTGQSVKGESEREGVFYTCVGSFVIMESDPAGGSRACPLWSPARHNLALHSINADPFFGCNFFHCLFKLLEAELPGTLQ